MVVVEGGEGGGCLRVDPYGEQKPFVLQSTTTLRDTLQCARSTSELQVGDYLSVQAHKPCSISHKENGSVN